MRDLLSICLVLLLMSCNRGSLEQHASSLKYITFNSEQSDYYRLIQYAVDNAIDGDTLKFSSGSFYCSGTINIVNKSLTILGDKNTKIFGSGKVFDVRNTRYHNAELNADIQAYKSSNLGGVKGVSGSMVCFESDEIFEEKSVPYKKSHCNEISPDSSNDLVFPIPISLDKRKTQIDYYEQQYINISSLNLTTQDAQYIITISGLNNVNIDKLNFTNPLKLNYGKGAFRNKNSGMSAMGIYNSINIDIDKCSFTDVWYGVLTHKGCNNIVVRNSEARRCRHLNNTALGTDNLKVINCKAFECMGGFDSHETAIGSTFDKCYDYKPVLESKFRGRLDVVNNSYFESGICMRYDKHIGDLLAQQVPLFKKLNNTKVKGGHSKFNGPNVSIVDSEINGSCEFQNNQGIITLDNLTINYNGLTKRIEAITLATEPMRGESYVLTMNQVNIKSENSVDKSIGVYIPVQGAKKATIKDLVVEGFDSGIVLYGGKDKAKNYSKMSLEDVKIVNCKTGIFHQKHMKSLNKIGVVYKNCLVNSNFPEYLKLSKKNVDE